MAAARAEVTAQHLAPAVVYEVGEMLEKYENPYVQQTPENVISTGAVALFVGDEALHRWPGAISAARTLIRATGVSAVEIGVGRNNGYLASSLGFPETARTLAKATLDELRVSGAGKLLVRSPGDYFAFNQHLVERLGLIWPEEVKLIELTSYLHDHFNAGRLTFTTLEDTTPYAYVDPAHAVRVPASRAAAPAILNAVLPM